MKINTKTDEFIGTITSYFKKETKKTRENIALCTYSILRGETVNTAEIARYMGEVNQLNFKSNDMRVYRLLQSKNFQVSDRLWRGYIALMLKMLKESGLKKGAEIIINVDYTSDRDDYLILCASICFQGESIPLYFSLRNYPKKAGAIDHKKLELAFFKELKHLLSDSYRYVIVADRGFGHDRIIKILENLNFKYIIRINPNLIIENKMKNINIKSLDHKDIKLKNAYVPKWKRKINLVKRVKGEAFWLLVVSPGIKRVVNKYEGRFSIEKMFKNKKSGGFNLEKLHIKKYDRFKRLLFISCLAYCLLVFTGFVIKNKAHPIKKNYSLHLKLLSVFSD